MDLKKGDIVRLKFWEDEKYIHLKNRIIRLENDEYMVANGFHGDCYFIEIENVILSARIFEKIEPLKLKAIADIHSCNNQLNFTDKEAVTKLFNFLEDTCEYEITYQRIK